MVSPTFQPFRGRSLELLDVTAAGIRLADTDNNLRVICASDEQSKMLELIQLQNDEGPCLDMFSTKSVPLSEAEIALAQALADVATIAIVQDLASRKATIREERCNMPSIAGFPSNKPKE